MNRLIKREFTYKPGLSSYRKATVEGHLLYLKKRYGNINFFKFGRFRAEVYNKLLINYIWEAPDFAVKEILKMVQKDKTQRKQHKNNPIKNK